MRFFRSFLFSYYSSYRKLPLNKQIVIAELLTKEQVTQYGRGLRGCAVTMSCPSEKRFLTGGGKCETVDPSEISRVFLKESHPFMSGNEVQYLVVCDSIEPIRIKAKAYIICE